MLGDQRSFSKQGYLFKTRSSRQTKTYVVIYTLKLEFFRIYSGKEISRELIDMLVGCHIPWYFLLCSYRLLEFLNQGR